MALRSLAVMLKELPRRMAGSGAFAPKGNPWSKSSTKLAYPCLEDVAKISPEIARDMKRGLEESQRQTRFYSRCSLLMSIALYGFFWQRMGGKSRPKIKWAA